MSISDENRVQRASEGDPLAVEELLERHLPGLRQYVRKNVSPLVLAKESASDIVQSACREVLADMPGFHYQGEAAFRAWLQQAALRKIIDRQRYYRADKRDPAHEVPIDAGLKLSRDELTLIAGSLGSPSGDAIREEEFERLARGLTRLDEADQRLIRMLFVEGLTHAQAAERLATNEVNSRKQLSRALARLSKHLA